jgi:hypothetical protein
MPAFRHAGGLARLDEMEPERATRLVQVETVRVFVVRDVDVRPVVSVHVREDDAERVVVRRRVDAGLPPDFAEARAAV